MGSCTKNKTDVACKYSEDEIVAVSADNMDKLYPFTTKQLQKCILDLSYCIKPNIVYSKNIRKNDVVRRDYIAVPRDNNISRCRRLNTSCFIFKTNRSDLCYAISFKVLEYIAQYNGSLISEYNNEYKDLSLLDREVKALRLIKEFRKLTDEDVKYIIKELTTRYKEEYNDKKSKGIVKSLQEKFNMPNRTCFMDAVFYINVVSNKHSMVVCDSGKNRGICEYTKELYKLNPYYFNINIKALKKLFNIKEEKVLRPNNLFAIVNS